MDDLMLRDNVSAGAYAETSEEIVQALRQEFRADAEAALRRLDLSLSAVRAGTLSCGPGLLNELQREAMVIKGQANSLGLSLLAVVAHRMADYLTNIEELSGPQGDEVQVFLDRLSDLLDGTIKADSDAAKVVRELPAKPSFDECLMDRQQVEVLLVMLNGTAARFVEREMQQCGYRISIVTSPFEALEMVVRTRPDLVVISSVLPELGGIDLITALAAMPVTRNTPLALITSVERDHASLGRLPEGVPVIRKGPSFGDDLAQALSASFLI